ncbi:SAM-dependent methyltransferase [uncultured Sutterella sp.]|uniref:SAM-dependent methyltransferase n=1 Tax=uncultured Sutterella sp. TaxID=286133 RepID=UPI00261E3BEC|nr:SAM-dependent methyltransferase [uncultured Sutterella sp.]
MSGTLYLIPCPISTSAPEETIPQRTLEVARSLDYFLVEAARTARGTLKSMGHPQPISTLTIEEIGHDPEAGKIDAWLAPVVEGRSAGIISESGCPGIADPGAQIVQRAHELGIRVVPLTGPSSLLLTLMASGLDGQRFRFLGYLPIHEDERRAAILAAEAASRASETQLCIETPYRNTAFLAGLIETLAPTTRLTVALDITGENESIRTKTVAEWKKATEEERTLPKIPCVFAFLAEPGKKQAPRYAPKNAARKGMGQNSSRGKPQGEKPFRKKRLSSNRS